MVYLKAFIVGGIICTLVQIFLDNTRLMPGRVMVLLVIAGVILGAVGIYEPLLQWAGCGASVPLSGFGYNLYKGVKTAIAKDGWLGVFTGGLTSCSAGIAAAIFFGFLAGLLGKPKEKK